MANKTIPTNTQLDLKYKGEYSKIKVAISIISTCNQALKDGLQLNSITWNVKWNKSKNKFSYTYSYHSWCSILSSIILYSNYTADELKPKIKVVAEILGVSVYWVQGFMYSVCGDYKSIVEKAIKRRSLKGQECRDGVEIGKLLRLAYLSNRILSFDYMRCSFENYKTHKWREIDENKIIISLGANQNNKIIQCEKCNLFGGKAFGIWENEILYFVSRSKFGESYFLTGRRNYIFNCDETIIKNILE